MTLNSEGLKKAAHAIAADTPIGQMHRSREIAEKAISAYLSALPPVDGLEVVAWDVAPKGLPAEPTKSLSFVAEIERQGGSITPLVTLSQASSVITGLKAEIDDLRDEWQAEYDTRLAANTARRDAVARIAELEAAIDSAEIAGGLTENGNLWRFWSQKAQETAGKAEARISSLEEENKRLRAVLSASADALGNGAFISTEASVEFMEMLPVEIRAFSSRIGDHNG